MCNRSVRFAATVARGHAIFATKRALPLTRTGLPPAESRVPSGATRAPWRTTRALITAPRERDRERLPGTMRPERETPAPAFFAAASACAMKGRARCIPDERMRPGRMRKSSSPLIVPVVNQIWIYW